MGRVLGPNVFAFLGASRYLSAIVFIMSVLFLVFMLSSMEKKVYDCLYENDYAPI
jgi:hypothetical protein